MNLSVFLLIIATMAVFMAESEGKTYLATKKKVTLKRPVKKIINRHRIEDNTATDIETKIDFLSHQIESLISKESQCSRSNCEYSNLMKFMQTCQTQIDQEERTISDLKWKIQDFEARFEKISSLMETETDRVKHLEQELEDKLKDCHCTPTPAFPPGCDCDSKATNTTSQCPAEQQCIDCKCTDVFPPGCDCDSKATNTTSQCPGEQQCIDCKCKTCKMIDGKVTNAELVFAIDNTGSMGSTPDLANQIVDRLISEKMIIPRYQLFTFADSKHDNIADNAKLVLDTEDVVAFQKATSGLKFSGKSSGDLPERMTQGLLLALKSSSPKSVIIVFTDQPTKNPELEGEINRLRKEKEVVVFIVLKKAISAKGLALYERMGQVFQLTDVSVDTLLENIEQKVEETKTCI